MSSIGNGVTYSTLDNGKNPTTGFSFRPTTNSPGSAVRRKFARNTEDARYYHPIIGDVVGMVRAQGGYATPWGGQQLPLLNGFFGGPQLVRGFAPNGFGPRDITPGTTMDNIGGNVYWTTSAELQSPVPFVPADARPESRAILRYRQSLGHQRIERFSIGIDDAGPTDRQFKRDPRFGRRQPDLGFMFGPIRVDYAYPIAKQPYDITQRLRFSAGGF